MSEKRLLLDTCALLWLAAGRGALSKSALETIEAASIVFVSPISAWEIDLKATRKTIVLPLPAEEWFNEVVAAHGLTLAPLSVDVLTMANRLPWHHKDPVDRFIIATAMKEDAGIVTTDRRFSKYKIRVIA